MSLKLRRGLITVLSAFVLLFASLAIFVAPNNFVKVNAEVIEAQLAGVQDNYILNAKLAFPTSVTEPIAAQDGVVIYPNGKVYKIIDGKEFTLNIAGNYTLRYFGENQVVEKTFLVTQKHFVLSTEETVGKNEIVAATKEVMEGQELPNGVNYPNNTAWPNVEQNLTALGNEALIVRMAAGTKFSYSVPIDLTKASADGLTDIISFVPRWGNYDRSRANSSANYIMQAFARNITITLTDCYDSSRYMRYIVQEGGDTNYSRAGTDNLPDAGWVFPSSKKATSDMNVREFYEGTEYGYAYIGAYGATPAGNLNEWVRRDAIHLKFDYDDAVVWATSFSVDGKSDYKETRIADFNNKSVYPTNDYRGFTTGEVYLTIEFGDYQTSDSARVDIFEIAGQNAASLIELRQADETGEPTAFFMDEKDPVINVDFAPTLNDGVFVDVGSYFTVPTAQAFDVSLKGDMKVLAYRNYSDPAHKVNIPIVNGKIAIEEEDIYTIVYYAEDASGNTCEKTIKVFGIKDANNPAVEFDIGTQLANLDAGRINILPKFTFNTRNDADKRQLSITISSDKETIELANLVGTQAIEEFLAKDAEFMLAYSGEYTIEYAYSDNANAGVVSYKITSNPSDVTSFVNTPILPRYLIKNATYDFEELYAYSYQTGSSQPYMPAEVYIAYDADVNVNDVAASNFTKLDDVYSNKITGSEKAVLKYAYESNVVYTDIATIVDVGIDDLAKLQQYKYFVGDFATAHPNDVSYDANLFDPEVYYPTINGRPNFDSAKLDFKSKTSSGDNTLQFINIIDLANFGFYFRIVDSSDKREDADNFNALKLVFTDPYNTANKVYAKIYKLADGSIFFDLNGEQSGRVNQVFSGNVDKYFTYNKSLALFSVSGITSKFTFDFGFTTTKAYLDIVLEGISGTAGVRVLEINGHKFSHDGRARTTPLSLMTIPQGSYTPGTVINISAAEFIDVLSPIIKEKVTLSVVGPDGSPLTALDGTVLDGTCDPYKSYQVRLGEMGQYKVSYSAVSGINQKSSPPGFVFVDDLIGPEITFEGDIYEGCVVYLKPGQKFTVKYSVQDDVSLQENIYTLIVWSNRYLVSVGHFLTNEIYFIKEGTYEVAITATDEVHNYSQKSFTVIVTNEEVE